MQLFWLDEWFWKTVNYYDFLRNTDNTDETDLR